MSWLRTSAGGSDHDGWLERAQRRAWNRARLEREAPTASLDDGGQKELATPMANTAKERKECESAGDSDDTEAPTLASLPDDALHEIGCKLLSMETRAAVRFCLTSSAMAARLQSTLVAAQARQVVWLPDWTALHSVSANGRTLTAEGEVCEDGLTLATDAGMTRSWAAGTELPSTGACAWSCRINVGGSGRMAIGVCDAAGVCAWGVEPFTGVLGRYTRDECGLVNLLCPAPPPPQYPCGVGLRMMATNLRGTTEGSVVEVSVDADSGVVGFVVDELGTARQRYGRAHVAYPRRHELRGFPRGVALRPWAMLYLHAGDQVELNGCLEEH